MKNEIPFLSVIVPAYNVQAYLPQCVDSILNQTYQDFELILVDDGSTDETGRLCDEYEKKEERVRVVHKMNGGLVSARKAGLSAARGEYVAYVDGDDWIAEDMFAKLCACAIHQEADIVIADFIYVTGNKQSKLSQNMKYGCYNKEDLLTRVYPKMLCGEDYFSFGLQPSLCSKVFRKSVLLKPQTEVNDEIRLGEDAACFYPTILSAEKVFYLKEDYFYYYRMRETSISHSISSSYYTEEIILLGEQLEKNFRQYDIWNDELSKQLYLYICYMLDNMMTPHLTLKQLFLSKELTKQLDIFVNRQIGREVITYCKNVRTSSRMKRMIQYILKRDLYTKVDLYLFVKYEKWSSR